MPPPLKAKDFNEKFYEAGYQYPSPILSSIRQLTDNLKDIF